MRSIIGLGVVTLAISMAGALPASANWSCQGPEMACGNAPSAAPAKYAKPGKVSHAKAKKGKYVETASLFDSYDQAPAKYRKGKKAYRASYDSEGGGTSYQSGMASYYSEPQRLASGGRFNPNAMTAAHKSLPFGTRVRVTNQHNGSSVVVIINDRGPYVGGRIIDLSRAAAGAIGMTGAGVAPVRIAVLGRG